MATTKRRTSTDLGSALKSELSAFDSMQARHLFHILSQSEGRSVPRYTSDDSLALATKSIKHERNSETLEVAESVLTGSQGILPNHYTELLLSQIRKKETAYKEFLDLFNQRTQELLYQSWLKHKLPQCLELQSNDFNTAVASPHSILQSMAGTLDSQAEERLGVSSNELMGLSGLLSKPVKSANAIRQICEHLLKLPVEVEQFQGEWLEIPADLQTSLHDSNSNREMNNQLGINTVLGQKNWFVQGKFNVVIKVSDEDTLLSIRPDRAVTRKLSRILKLATGKFQDFNLILEAPKRLLKPVQLSHSDDKKPLLGWNTQLGTQENDSQTVRINISYSLEQ